MIQAATRLLTAAARDGFPSTVTVGLDPGDAPPGASQAFRKAAAFVLVHAGDDICVSDGADPVNLAPRALQYIFRQEADATPMEYLRRIRLRLARADLVKGNRADTTVAEVARRWGFGHRGRFSVLYRQAYGESPARTLAT